MVQCEEIVLIGNIQEGARWAERERARETTVQKVCTAAVAAAA